MKKRIGTAIAFGALCLSGCSWIYELSPGSLPEGVSEGNSTVPSFSYTDQFGQAFGTEELQGTYWLADMIFTNCPSVCPIMTPNMRNLQDFAFEENLALSFVSFTVDPENDDEARLLSYSENVAADNENWRFLTGYSQGEIATLSEEAFLSPVEESQDGLDIVHSTRFFLVDPAGDVVRMYNGLALDQSSIKEDLKTILP
ncbi:MULTISPECIES: SCO family protein [Bacillaceae]|uniref:Transporter n=1 Tax=Alkalicoccobacillus plakortidis TaxID=444060 RepID=A0A9D5DS92_9BACI|nr:MULTISPECIES: SCO family protein [Bacillaceae]KQL58952.1 transporter [Alkalicoccobacillus plakortidis]